MSINHSDNKNMTEDSSAKSPLNVTDLPDEVLIEIFDYLDVQCLMDSRLVCKSWNEAILSSPKLMKKVSLVIDSEKIEQFSDNLKLSRGHQTIRFEFLSLVEIPKYFIEGLKEISDNVTTVNFSSCDNSDMIHSLFKCFPSAEHVEFQFCFQLEISKLNPEVFAGCKTLKVECYEILPCFDEFQLTKLKLHDIASPMWTVLFDFLSKQTRLSSLTLCAASKIPSELELPVIKCHVKELKIDGDENDIVDQKFIEFIELFGESVTSLKILDCFGKREDADELDLAQKRIDSFTLFSSITKTFKSLVKLEIFGFIFSSEFDLDQLPQLQNVIKLVVGSLDFEVRSEVMTLWVNLLNLFPQLGEIDCVPRDNVVSYSSNLFWRFFFDRGNLQILPAGLKTIKIDPLTYYDYGQIVKVENKFMRLTIHFEDEFMPLLQFHLALKIIENFDLPKDGLMMTQHKATDMPEEWNEVTEVNFAAMRLNEPYDLSVLSHLIYALFIEKLDI